MKKLLIAVALTVATTSTMADTLALAKANACLACHAMDRKLVGEAQAKELAQWVLTAK